jgi:glutathione S-transferase
MPPRPLPPYDHHRKGLAYPLTAAIVNAVWVVGRIMYTLGYSTGDPKKRIPGAGASGLAYLGTIIATLVLGLRVAFAG